MQIGMIRRGRMDASRMRRRLRGGRACVAHAVSHAGVHFAIGDPREPS